MFFHLVHNVHSVHPVAASPRRGKKQHNDLRCKWIGRSTLRHHCHKELTARNIILGNALGNITKTKFLPAHSRVRCSS